MTEVLKYYRVRWYMVEACLYLKRVLIEQSGKELPNGDDTSKSRTPASNGSDIPKNEGLSGHYTSWPKLYFINFSGHTSQIMHKCTNQFQMGGNKWWWPVFVMEFGRKFERQVKLVKYSVLSPFTHLSAGNMDLWIDQNGLVTCLSAWLASVSSDSSREWCWAINVTMCPGENFNMWEYEAIKQKHD